jgi:hypothetical protein
MEWRAGRLFAQSWRANTKCSQDACLEVGLDASAAAAVWHCGFESLAQNELEKHTLHDFLTFPELQVQIWCS